MIKPVLTGLAIGAIIITLAFGIGYLSFELANFFKPKYTALDYKTFKESQQYNESMIRAHRTQHSVKQPWIY